MIEHHGRAARSRRDFIRLSSLAAAVPLLPGQTPHLIVRERDPENLEFPFTSLNSFITPTDSFYVRNHFQMPQLDPGSWRLRVEGAVDNPFDIGLADLRKLTERKVTATLECAGNSRVLLVPSVAGAQWELGAVSNAEWTGVPLSVLLDRAGLKSNAAEVVLEGADKGAPKNDPRPPGDVSFARSLPMDKARSSEVLIAWGMNGGDLPQNHGFPVRAVVPGYYGMSSVKWLTSIRVLTEQFRGYWQTTDYAYWDRSAGIPVRRPLREMQIKSLIAQPTLREAVQAGVSRRVAGAAWTGDADISKVEVSSDGGRTWAEARLIDKPVRWAWRRWELDWKVPAQAGRYTLMSRATDTSGNVQPAQHNKDTGSYAIHHVLPIEVDVISSARR